MNDYEVKPLSFGKNIVCKVPGSKSITNRAFLLAALAEGESRLNGIRMSGDAVTFLNALNDLGYDFVLNEREESISILGRGGDVPVKRGEVNVGSAGTAARFITAMLAFSDGAYRIRSSSQMAKRPMKELLVALEELGARFDFMEVPYHLPYQVTGGMQISRNGDQQKKVKIRLNIDKSSQFLSALLMASVLREEDLTIVLSGERKAKSYVNMTIKMMEEFGCRVIHNKETIDMETNGEDDVYLIRKGSRYRAREYGIEPDVSAACYFYAMAACTGGSALVEGVRLDSIQGDVRFIDVLERMGCDVKEKKEGICLTGPKEGKIKGVHVDLSDLSDQTMTLAAIAPFADSPVTIGGVGHIRGQETDRIHAICEELTRMGIRNEEGDTWLRVYPGKPKPVTVQTYDDHRMAMAFAVTGLRTPGLRIGNPDCCSKTFPDYFDTLDGITKRR